MNPFKKDTAKPSDQDELDKLNRQLAKLNNAKSSKKTKSKGNTRPTGNRYAYRQPNNNVDDELPDEYGDKLNRLDKPAKKRVNLISWWKSLKVDGHWNMQALLVRLANWLGTLSPWKVFRKAVKWTLILGVLTFITVIFVISYIAENEQMKQKQAQEREAKQTELTSRRIAEVKGDQKMTNATRKWQKQQLAEAQQTIADNLDLKVQAPPATTVSQINKPYEKITDNYHMTAGNYIYWVKHSLPSVMKWKYSAYPQVTATYDVSMHRLTVSHSNKLTQDQKDYLWKWAHHIYVNSEWVDTHQKFDMQFK